LNSITKEQKQLVTLYALGKRIWNDSYNDILKDSPCLHKFVLTFSYEIMKRELNNMFEGLEDGLTDDDWRELLNDIRNKAS
jgi:hypothetical protein